MMLCNAHRTQDANAANTVRTRDGKKVSCFRFLRYQWYKNFPTKSIREIVCLLHVKTSKRERERERDNQ